MNHMQHMPQTGCVRMELTKKLVSNRFGHSVPQKDLHRTLRTVLPAKFLEAAVELLDLEQCIQGCTLGCLRTPCSSHGILEIPSANQCQDMYVHAQFCFISALQPFKSLALDSVLHKIDSF